MDNKHTPGLTNRATLETLRFLLYRRKTELFLCTSADEIKKVVWDATKDHITNMPAYLKGQKLIQYDALYTWLQA
jgi:hypothetical protein